MTSGKDRGSVETLSSLLGTNMDILVYNPPGQVDPALAVAASSAGALGVLDLEYIDPDGIAMLLKDLKGGSLPFGVRVDPMSEKLQALITGELPQNLKLLVAMPKETLPDMVRSTIYETAHSMGLKVLQEVCTVEEAEASAEAGVDGLVLRGSEGGGRVSSMPGMDLLREIRKEIDEVPMIIRGGVKAADMGSLDRSQISGLVLDSELLTTSEASLPDGIRSVIEGFGPGSTFILGDSTGRSFRFIADEGTRNELVSLEQAMVDQGEDPKTIYMALKERTTELVLSSLAGGAAVLYPAGEELSSAKEFESYGGVVEALSDLIGGPAAARDERTDITIEEKKEGEMKVKGNVTVDGKPVPPDYYDTAVAVVGIGSVFPKAIGTEKYWKLVVDGVDASGEVPKDRWDWTYYYDPDRKVPDKTYTKIGAFITDFEMDFREFRLPPKLFEQIDLYQRYAMKAAKEALADANLLDNNDIDRTRVGVMVANSGGGENRDWGAIRVGMDNVYAWMDQVEDWSTLPQDARDRIKTGLRKIMDDNIIQINEDSMPGCLPNIASGRLANIFNFKGPNFITDAACASSLAAVHTSRNALALKQIDIAVSGGTDSVMTAQSFVEFCKIGALTPDGSRPFAEGANGFLMGEGSGIVILKRLEDAVESGDKIYGIVKGIGASSDGKAKGITAPNPEGQQLALISAYKDARIDPSTISFVEAHGTSTAVGDVAELNSLGEFFSGVPPGSIGLTSIKSQIGHLKSAAGAAGMIKSLLAITNRTLPPQINFEKPNPYYDWTKSPFHVLTEAKEWKRIREDVPRRCGVSAFGFGGTNFHVILEEFDRDIYDAWKEARENNSPAPSTNAAAPQPTSTAEPLVDMDGIRSYLEKHGEEEGEFFIFSSNNPLDLLKQAEAAVQRAQEISSKGGRLRDAFEMPSYEGRYRLGIAVSNPEHFGKQVALLKKVGLDEKGLMALAAKGIFVGDRERMDHGKVCFMFPGQGSQYINMFRELRNKFRIVKETFEEADGVMKDLIPQPLSSYVFRDVEPDTPEYTEASETLRRTEFNQPSMLTVDTSMYKLLDRLGVEPDLAMGHSLGEYGALIASGVMDFGDALKAVSARGREMRDLKVEDPGKMASIMAGLDVVEEVLSEVDGYVIPANKNCLVQTVIAGESDAVDQAIKKFGERGVEAVQLPVSHAFHSGVVAPVKDILRNYLSKLTINPPRIPLLSNVTGDYYPQEGDPAEVKEQILDLLKEQVASSVEWISQVTRAHADGCRTFIEVGPKRALTSFAYNLMEEDVKKGRVFPITSNHPKKGGMATYNEMVAFLWALGFDLKIPAKDDDTFYNREFIDALKPFVKEAVQVTEEKAPAPAPGTVPEPAAAASGQVRMVEPPSSFQDFLSTNRDAIDRFLKEVYGSVPRGAPQVEPIREDVDLSGIGTTVPTRRGARVVVTGAAFGLPGMFKKVFTDENLDLLVQGRTLIDAVSEEYMEKFIEKNIIRLDKKPDGSAEMVKLDDGSKVLQLAGRLGEFDLQKEFGVPESVIDSLDITSQLAFAAGLLALKDAGIPLVKRYSQTSTGSFLPEEWELPLELQEDTGIIFASAFPGFDRLYKEMAEYCSVKIEKATVQERRRLYEVLKDKVKGTELQDELEELLKGSATKEYLYPRNFMFRVLAMGHSQFAQYIKAKGPNTQINSACATSTIGIGIAQDWIQSGRCKRVLVLGADDPSSDMNMEWFGSSLLALGALTNEKDITKAAMPFDERRKGMILGSGASAILVEAEEEPMRRGMNPIVEIMGSHIGNSAYHGSRLDVAHIARSMDRFIYKMERLHGFKRDDIAPDMVFMSHETYTPARGGSSAAEVESLRRTFGEKFREIIILNTKGFTGHAFGACLEDPALVKSLEKGVQIPIANLTPEHIDKQFEGMQLSRGGKHDRHYGLRLAAGFGSQLSFLLVRKPDQDGRFRSREKYNKWLRSIATTEPVELEVIDNVLRLKDSGRDNLIPHRAVRRESSQIGYQRSITEVTDQGYFNEVRDQVVSIFARKMGFPEDTIDIDGDLEADLGIDTVKQVELFGAARVHFGLPKDEGVNLRDYPTLRHVINYIIHKKGPSEKKAVEEAAPPSPPEPEVREEVKEKDQWEVVRDQVISIVSEKTGYPDDMLELDLDLEADLGIDTVKQVELFALAREEFSLPRDDNINLSDLNTLRKIIDYAVEKMGGEIPGLTAPIADEKTCEAPPGKEPVSEPEPEQEPAPQAAGITWEQVKDQVISLVAEKTGYPDDMLELDLDLEADLGIDTVKQVELFATAREDFSLPKDDTINLSELNTLRKIIDYVMEKIGGTAPTEPAPAVEEKKAEPAPAEEEKAEPVVEEDKTVQEPKGTEVNWDRVRDKVVEIVAEKTGYPEDMLELDLDLEADLGIDTVKQVELFATAREDFSLPRDDTINLSELNTLRKIIDYVSEKMGAGVIEEASLSEAQPPKKEEPVKEDAVPPASEEEPETEELAPSVQEAPVKEEPVRTEAAPSTADHWENVKSKVIEIVAEKTGYPEDMLELDLDLEADLGIDTVKQVELFAMAREDFSLPRDDSISLQDMPTLRHIIDYVASKVRPEEAPAAPEPVVEETPAPPPQVADEAPPAPAKTGVKEEKGTGSDLDLITRKVVEIVAEKTGYPEDMLELDLDLEADLGIDTVKQVELFAMARENFSLPRDDTINLSDLNTLRKIIEYIASKGVIPSGQPEVVEEKKVEIEQLTEEQLRERINRWVLQADEAPAVTPGESPVRGRKALIIGGDDNTAALLKEKLGVEPVLLPQGVSEFDENLIPEVEGIICVAPLFLEDDPDPEGWDALSASTSKLLFAAAKAMDKRLKDGGFLYSITAMGGKFALNRPVNPFNGSVSGFTKAVGREYPNADVIALDVDPSMGVEKAIDLLVAEVSKEGHPLEVGHDLEKRYLPAMRIILQPQEENLKFTDGMSILVSGGGGGITAEIIKGIAKRAKVKLHIIDIAELLPDTDKLASLDEEGLALKKEEIRQEMEKDGTKVTPVMLDREFSRITRSIGVHRLMKELESMGSEPHYHRSDIRDSASLAKIAHENGPFDGIIHAAGIEQSKSLVSKKQEDFDRVFDIKVQGAKALLDATREHPIRFFLTFTSVAGRFGNAGQVDYSSANDLLAKLRGALLKYHPDCTFKAVGWSAWAGVGMASKGAVKTLLEMGGITFIPVDDGIEYAISEIIHGKEREVYYSGSLGPMDKGGVLKWSEGIHPPMPAGSDIVPPVVEKPSSPKGPAPLIDEVMMNNGEMIKIKRSLDGIRERFLPDHSIMGTMVLPGVMGLELFAETASVLCPDLQVVELRDIMFKKAVNVKETLDIFVEGGVSAEESGGRVVTLRVYSILRSKKTGKEVEVEHYQGSVFMGQRSNECQKVADHPARPRNVLAQVLRPEIYNHLFHGPRFQVMEGMEVLKDGELVGIYHPAPEDLFDPKTGWKNGDLVTAPMQTECGFQTAGAYVLDRFKLMALPVKVGVIEYNVDTHVSEPGIVWVRFEGREDSTFKFDVDFLDRNGNVRFSYRDYRLKSMMNYDGELKGDHSVTFEEFHSPDDSVRVFRIDLDSAPEDLEKYVRYFGEDEWGSLVTEKMTQKRRREHTMGRVIAKMAVSWYLATTRYKVVPVKSIRIETEEKGKPYAVVDGERIEISISHSHRWAVCSVGSKVHGVDIELAEHRDRSFVDEAFTETEARLISEKQKEYDVGENMMQTLFFSAKESYLKMMGLGLSVDLRSVQCSEVVKLPNKGGISFDVFVNREGDERKVQAHVPSAYVLTVCVDQ
ncbi:MAG: beta-ketoacyl synthase N-terminal-like domain-containing protein [Thermoplasmatota archaeon]